VKKTLTDPLGHPVPYAIITWVHAGEHIPADMHAKIALSPLERTLIANGVINASDLHDAYATEIETGRWQFWEALPPDAYDVLSA
jgi:hypothetical protein